MKEILVGKISRKYLAKFFPDLSLGVSAGYCQRSLVAESVIIIRPQVGRHNRSVMVVMYGAPCAIPPLIFRPF
jgi:hypothetical protein